MLLVEPTVSDNCEVASITNNAPDQFDVGTTTVIWTVTDVAGNTGTCEQLVTVEDNEDPTITSPSDITVAPSGGSRRPGSATV